MSGAVASAFLPNREPGREVLVERKRVREREMIFCRGGGIEGCVVL
jgi:hypothetical protein